MSRMSDLDIVRQEHGLPEDTPLEVLVALAEADELGYREDMFWLDRLEDKEV